MQIKLIENESNIPFVRLRPSFVLITHELAWHSHKDKASSHFDSAACVRYSLRRFCCVTSVVRVRSNLAYEIARRRRNQEVQKVPCRRQREIERRFR
ncbi:unnamed protein product [Leptosia nina]|uniref:Uncharacterized protein n=1 Tax=Leptosia nina TaxID=320188 RepID=A0AAV1JUR1_9NEOP